MRPVAKIRESDAMVRKAQPFGENSARTGNLQWCLGQIHTPCTACRPSAAAGSILSRASHEDRSALARESGVNLWWPGTESNSPAQGADTGNFSRGRQSSVANSSAGEFNNLLTTTSG